MVIVGKSPKNRVGLFTNGGSNPLDYPTKWGDPPSIAGKYVLPRKLTYPLKNDGWKMDFLLKIVLFLGTCYFSRVYIHVQPNCPSEKV